MCKYCDMFITEDEGSGWIFQKSAEYAPELDGNAKMWLCRTFENGKRESAYMTVEWQYDWVEKIPFVLAGEVSTFKYPIRLEESLIFDGISFCPFCGRDLFEESDADA